MREDTVFARGRSCGECLQGAGKVIRSIEKEKRIMKELGNSQVQQNQRKMNLSKQIEIVQSCEKSSCNNLDGVEKRVDIDKGPSRKMSVPQVTITRPINDIEKADTAENGDCRNNEDKNDQQNEDVQKSGGKIAGRRALPEITITCPPVEVFDNQDNQEDVDFNNGLFTQRRYMICRESPRSGKKTISLVDFPHGLSALEKMDSLYVESPANFLDSPYSFSNVDFSFTYSSPLGSPFTPPFTPEMRKSSKFVYPGPVPVFPLEESFPPANFKDEKVTVE